MTNSFDIKVSRYVYPLQAKAVEILHASIYVFTSSVLAKMNFLRSATETQDKSS
jgi:hypothetical protein